MTNEVKENIKKLEATLTNTFNSFNEKLDNLRSENKNKNDKFNTINNNRQEDYKKMAEMIEKMLEKQNQNEKMLKILTSYEYKKDENYHVPDMNKNIQNIKEAIAKVQKTVNEQHQKGMSNYQDLINKQKEIGFQHKEKLKDLKNEIEKQSLQNKILQDEQVDNFKTSMENIVEKYQTKIKAQRKKLSNSIEDSALNSQIINMDNYSENNLIEESTKFISVKLNDISQIDEIESKNIDNSIFTHNRMRGNSSGELNSNLTNDIKTKTLTEQLEKIGNDFTNYANGFLTKNDEKTKKEDSYSNWYDELEEIDEITKENVESEEQENEYGTTTFKSVGTSTMDKDLEKRKKIFLENRLLRNAIRKQSFQNDRAIGEKKKMIYSLEIRNVDIQRQNAKLQSQINELREIISTQEFNHKRHNIIQNKMPIDRSIYYKNQPKINTTNNNEGDFNSKDY